jgi:hypothetical protein
MRSNRFAHSVVFAAAAAAGWFPWALVVGPVAGVWTARTLYLVGTTVLYVAGLCPARGRRLPAAVAVGLIATGFALAARTTTELSIGLAVVLGIARSVFFYRTTAARAVRTEAALLVTGLLFARFLAGASLLSTALAMWGFLLVQSLFFLVGKVWPRAVTEGHPDPFDAAYHHALALLERTGI